MEQNYQYGVTNEEEWTKEQRIEATTENKFM
jgi:hypothetical protein